MGSMKWPRRISRLARTRHGPQRSRGRLVKAALYRVTKAISGDFRTSVLGKPQFFLIKELNFKGTIELKRHLKKPEVLTSLLSRTCIKHVKTIKIRSNHSWIKTSISHQTWCSAWREHTDLDTFVGKRERTMKEARRYGRTKARGDCAWAPSFLGLQTTPPRSPETSKSAVATPPASQNGRQWSREWGQSGLTQTKPSLKIGKPSKTR